MLWSVPLAEAQVPAPLQDAALLLPPLLRLLALVLVLCLLVCPWLCTGVPLVPHGSAWVSSRGAWVVLLAPKPCGVCACVGCLGDGRTWKTYSLAKGPSFALQKKKAATDLTREMLQL